jgi:hypothetical protein
MVEVTSVGTLVISEDGYFVTGHNNVVVSHYVKPQKFDWARLFKEDKFVDKWLKRILRDFSEGNFSAKYFSVEREKELRTTVKEFFDCSKKFTIIDGELMFRHMIQEEGRVVWTRDVSIAQGDDPLRLINLI